MADKSAENWLAKRALVGKYTVEGGSRPRDRGVQNSMGNINSTWNNAVAFYYLLYIGFCV